MLNFCPCICFRFYKVPRDGKVKRNVPRNGPQVLKFANHIIRIWRHTRYYYITILPMLQKTLWFFVIFEYFTQRNAICLYGPQIVEHVSRLIECTYTRIIVYLLADRVDVWNVHTHEANVYTYYYYTHKSPFRKTYIYINIVIKISIFNVQWYTLGQQVSTRIISNECIFKCARDMTSTRWNVITVIRYTRWKRTGREKRVSNSGNLKVFIW